MKKHKVKKIFILPISILLIFIVIGVNHVNHLSSLSYSKKVIKELNDNTSFPYKFTTKMDRFNLDDSEWDRYEEFNEIFYTNKKDEEVLMFCGYPDLSNSVMLTSYRSGNNHYSVFGISVGDKVSFADQHLKKFGYKNTDQGHYEKGRVTILIGNKRIERKGEIIDVVSGFSIYLYSSDRFRKGNYK